MYRQTRGILIVLSIILLPLFIININPIEATVTGNTVGGTTQYKEHNYQNSSLPTLTVFSQANSTEGGFVGSLRMKSGSFVPPLLLSQNFFMITFQKNLLSGAHFNTRLNVSLRYLNAGGANSEYSVVVWDQSQNRAASNVFVNASALDFQGVEQPLQTIVNQSTLGFVNVSAVLNIGGIGKYITVVIFLADYDIGFGAELWVLDLKLINTSDSSIMYHNDFQCKLESDVSGTLNDYGFCGVDSGDPPLIGNFTSLSGFQILNLEPCGNFVFAEEKAYNFELTIGGANVTDTVLLQFNDGITNITFRYDHINRIPDHVSGSEVATMGTVTAVTNSTNFMLVTFPIFFKNTILDSLNRNVTARANDTGGFDTGWTNVGSNAFNIYNKGGFSQTVSSGTAGRVDGGDTFELFAQNNSWVYTNQTFRKIQQLSTQFSLRFTENGTGEDQFMQDKLHAPGAEKSSAKGDWQIEIAMNYCDESADIFVKGFYIILQMEDGDVGADDQWINFNATWYNRDGSFIRSEIFNGWIELESISQVRIWFDIWFNKQNSSTLGGGRTTAYYFGMHKTPFGIFGGDWSPQIINATESLAFIDLLDNSSSLISSPQLDLMFISFNVTRPITQNATDWRLTLRDFDVLEYKLRDNKQQMEGINTPTPNKPKVPDMPVTGFLAPLYAAITGIGAFVANAMTGLANIAWGFIESQFPWFTGFIDAISASLGNLSTIFFAIYGNMSNGFAFVAERIWLLATPILIVTDTWGLLVDNIAIFFVVNPAEVSLLMVIMLGVIPLMDAVSRGDSSFIIRALSLAWGAANTMMQFFIRLGQIVINIALEFWPF